MLGFGPEKPVRASVDFFNNEIFCLPSTKNLALFLLGHVVIVGIDARVATFESKREFISTSRGGSLCSVKKTSVSKARSRVVVAGDKTKTKH